LGHSALKIRGTMKGVVAFTVRRNNLQDTRSLVNWGGLS
jgi:hypothetical protein